MPRQQWSLLRESSRSVLPVASSCWASPLRRGGSVVILQAMERAPVNKPRWVGAVLLRYSMILNCDTAREQPKKPSNLLRDNVNLLLRGIPVAAHRMRIDRLESDTDALRREIGLFEMMWLRSHLPIGTDDMGNVVRSGQRHTSIYRR